MRGALHLPNLSRLQFAAPGEDARSQPEPLRIGPWREHILKLNASTKYARKIRVYQAPPDVGPHTHHYASFGPYHFGCGTPFFVNVTLFARSQLDDVVDRIEVFVYQNDMELVRPHAGFSEGGGKKVLQMKTMDRKYGYVLNVAELRFQSVGMLKKPETYCYQTVRYRITGAVYGIDAMCLVPAIDRCKVIY